MVLAQSGDVFGVIVLLHMSKVYEINGKDTCNVQKMSDWFNQRKHDA